VDVGVNTGRSGILGVLLGSQGRHGGRGHHGGCGCR
jgi:hypothetical protein